eukprot:scaffold57222_cov27-Prasinocladus_malaysianus.AAC.1
MTWDGEVVTGLKEHIMHHTSGGAFKLMTKTFEPPIDRQLLADADGIRRAGDNGLGLAGRLAVHK